ncbi:aminotransferase class I/II-fold pyridoxal phosphate-dependent enzyme [Bacillota bacterium LX-D]|nr:aminotransferase class I/II-fold pyridoxal phosphate-dependent enzyme [Bacillota bacterium LX-D]
MEIKMPLVEKIMEHLGQDRVRFHMPGHKGFLNNSRLEQLLGAKVFQADLTEIPGLDDLHQPQGVIGEAETLAAQLFKAEATFFLVNGATAGIEAAMLAFCPPRSKVLVPRIAHKSVLNGLILSGAVPVYLESKITAAGIFLPPREEDIISALRENKDITALCLTNPTYLGLAGKLGEIREIACRSKQRLIVDEAHGAHFYFHTAFPPSALELKADAVVHGTHKTLGSLTQTAMLHLSKAEDKIKIREALGLVQSTSPSYILLASLDACRHRLEAGNINYGKTVELAQYARDEINKLKGFWCLGAEVQQLGLNYDPTKLVIGCRQMSGYKLEQILRLKYQIDLEMAKEFYVLAMVTINDQEQSIGQLITALKEISQIYRTNDSRLSGLDYLSLTEGYPLPKVIVPPREAFFSSSKKVPWFQAQGQVCGETIIPYPPGIPLICPGELIDANLMEAIAKLKAFKIQWQGLSDPELKTVRIIDN